MYIGWLHLLRFEPIEHRPKADSVHYRCDVCFSDIKEGEKRYSCQECVESYDLCNECHSKGKGEKHTREQGVHHDYILEQYSNITLKDVVSNERLETCFRNAFHYFSHRPAFGNYNPSQNTFVYTSYADFYKLVKQFASGLRYTMKTDWTQMVAICSTTRLEWYIADIACTFLGVPTVGIGAYTDSDSMAFILRETEASVIVCSPDVFKKLDQIDMKSIPSLKAAIVMDEFSNDTCIEVHSNGISGASFSAIVATGKEHYTSMKQFNPSPSSVYTIVYTSGSTGRPKGCVFTRQTWRNRMHISYMASKMVWISFLEPSHLFEREMIQNLILTGGKVGFHRNSMDHLFDDFALVRPTIISSTPRFWNLVYNQYLNVLYHEYKLYVKSASAQEDKVQGGEDHVRPLQGQELVSKLMEDDNNSATKNIDAQHVPEEVRKMAMKKFSSILGGRQRMVSTGGAPTAPAVKEFLEECFNGLFHEGYGASEVGGIATGGNVVPDATVKLIDVPEMGYFTTDDPPKGEICVQSTAMVDGYFKNDAETAEKFVDGYFRTGDIGVMEKAGKVTVIDRKKNIFKLAQGEFVSPERLENIYTSSSHLIEQVYVYGNTLQMNVVAVVVPHKDGLIERLHNSTVIKDHPESSLQELCSLAEIKSLYLHEIRNCAKVHQLKGWEVPIDILLESEMFTEKNGLLTSSLKLSRPNLEKKYRLRLEDLYRQLQDADGRPLEALVIDHFKSLSNLSPQNVTKHLPSQKLPETVLTMSFTQLGGDSIAAMKFASLIEEHFNRQVSVQAIMVEPLQNILQQVVNKPILFDASSPSINWSKEVLLDFVTRQYQKDSTSSAQSEAKTVFMTGATGFLGRYILLELLKNPKCHLVYCLVRNTIGTSSEERMQSVLTELGQHITLEEWSSKMVVVKGDLSRPNLDLSEDDYKIICNSVDVIIHNGAVVNAALPYQALKSSNVDSTKEIIKMACNGRSKFIHYVSTIGIFAPEIPSDPISEDSAPSSQDRLCEISGYGQSKWVADKLVLSAIEKGVINGNISRPGLIGPHSSTGDANPQDWVCWLVRGLAKLKKYPEGPGCSEVIDFIPVDYVAKAVVYLSVEEQGQRLLPHIFHLANDEYPVPYSKLIETLKRMFFPMMESSSYAEFRALLTRKARILDDSVLCSLDLLLPLTGGWSCSQNLQNKRTRDILSKTGIIYSLENDDEYIEKYLRNLHCRGLFK